MTDRHTQPNGSAQPAATEPARLALIAVDELEARIEAATRRALESARLAQEASSRPAALSVDAAAKMLGVSYKTIRRWCEQGRLQWRRVGGRRFVIAASVDVLLEGGSE